MLVGNADVARCAAGCSGSRSVRRVPTAEAISPLRGCVWPTTAPKSRLLLRPAWPAGRLAAMRRHVDAAAPLVDPPLRAAGRSRRLSSAGAFAAAGAARDIARAASAAIAIAAAIAPPFDAELGSLIHCGSSPFDGELALHQPFDLTQQVAFVAAARSSWRCPSRRRGRCGRCGGRKPPATSGRS